MSDRHSQEGVMDSVTEGMECRKGRWRLVGLLFVSSLGCTQPQCQGLPGAPCTPVPTDPLTHRDSSPEWIPALQYHQVQILDCGDQVSTKGQVCKSNGDVKGLGGKPEVAKVRWQMASPT